MNSLNDLGIKSHTNDFPHEKYPSHELNGFLHGKTLRVDSQASKMDATESALEWLKEIYLMPKITLIKKLALSGKSDWQVHFDGSGSLHSNTAIFGCIDAWIIKVGVTLRGANLPRIQQLARQWVAQQHLDIESELRVIV